MTNAAWIGQHEVVEVTYRPTVVSFEQLLQHAVQHSCDQQIFTSSSEQARIARTIVAADKVQPFPGQVRPGKNSDQLYYLSRSPYRWLPLTALQARRINSDLFFRKDPQRWLSPRQKHLWQRIELGRKNESVAARLEKLSHSRSVATLAADVRALEEALAPMPKD